MKETMSCYKKSDRFWATTVWGTVPAAFSADASQGVGESNSIARMIARLGEAKGKRLYGADPFEASTIDSFMDKALGIEAELYPAWFYPVLGYGTPSEEKPKQAKASLIKSLIQLNRRLSYKSPYLMGESLTLADIAVACSLYP